MFHQTSLPIVSFVAAVLFAAGIAAAQDSDGVGVVIVDVQADPNKAPPKPTGTTLKAHVIGADVTVSHGNFTLRAPVGKYQIGVACFPVDGALRAQLRLAEGQGLLVDNVLPNQPAAKAGVKKYDVILSVNGAKAGDLKDLVTAIDKGKGKAITLELLRGGKKHTIGLTPVKRHQPAVIGHIEGKLPNGVIKGLTVEGFRPFSVDSKNVKGDFHMRVVRPGVFIGQHVQLSKNLSITIKHSGEAPAKITVKKGDQKWEVTDKELDKLPKYLREHVQRIMGRSRPYNFVPKDSKWSVKVWDIESGKELIRPYNVVPAQPRAQHSQPVEKQLEQMRGELHEIRKALDELLKSRRKPRGKKAKSE